MATPLTKSTNVLRNSPPMTDSPETILKQELDVPAILARLQSELPAIRAEVAHWDKVARESKRIPKAVMDFEVNL